MKLEISLVPPAICHQWVGGLLPYLEKSEAWTRGRATVIDIIQFLYTGQMNLWMVYEKENEEFKPYGYIITEVKSYPQCKMLVVQYCAGEPQHMKYVEDDMYALLERFAKDAGCAGIEFFGRPGWNSSAKKHGFMVQTVVYERYFDGVKS
jgi:hypothetical protein